MNDDLPRALELRDGRIATIARTVEADAAAVLAFLDIVARETDFLTFEGVANVFTVEGEAEFIRMLGNPEKGLMLKAVVDDEIVGSATLQRGPRPRIQHAGELGLSVRRDHWALGVGRALCEAMVAGAWLIGMTRVALRVRADNERAIRLYESLGFEHEGRLRGAFAVGSVEYDDLMMAIRPRSEGSR